MDGPGQNPTYYDVLQLHPAAPLDLITAVYWHLAGKAQAARSSDPGAEGALRALTRAYEALADHTSRAAYDKSLGIETQHAVPKLPARRRRLFRRFRMKPLGDDAVDYYEVLRVAPTADPLVLTQAYHCLRDFYLRFIHHSQAPPELMDLLEEAYAITSDAVRRGAYDEARRRLRDPVRPAGPNRGVTSPSHKRKNQTSQPATPGPVGGAAVVDAQTTVPAPGPPAAAASPRAQPVSDTAPVLARTMRDSAMKGPAVKRSDHNRSDAKPGQANRESTKRQKPARPANGDGESASPLKTVGGGASNLARRLGRQFDSMRKREMELEHEVASRQGQDRAEDRQAEEALAQRLSARMTAGSERPTKEPVHFWVQLVDGPGAGVAFELKDLPVTLGADSDCDVTIPALEGQEARLLFREGLFLVHVIAGPDATEDDGGPAQWWVLEDGEDFRLGSCVLRLSARAD
ncbi:MAG TPA: DnaJ domain-containing protein [Dehalococcoidia bacterium]|nr:DnaJ domain-containing protein [Dehalococcoidia bacterium]